MGEVRCWCVEGGQNRHWETKSRNSEEQERYEEEEKEGQGGRTIRRRVEGKGNGRTLSSSCVLLING